MFSDVLRTFRRKRGFSQKALAEQSGVTLRAISALENCVRKAPYRDTVQRLASALELSPDEIAELWAAADSARTTSRRNQVATTDRPFREKLVGRAEALDEIAALLERERLVTLTGYGGIGKTSLALDIARRMRATYRDGVCVVDCADFSGVDELVAAIARDRRISVHPFGSIDALSLALCGQDALLVLETCEILEDASGIAEALLRTCSGMTILATSRRRMMLSSEVVYHVGPLAFEAACSLAPEIAKATPRTSVPLDGVPLLLAMAASVLADGGVESVRKCLSRDALDLAWHQTRGPERHRSVVSNLEWSYGLLGADEQTLLRRIATFDGSFSADDVTATCRAEETPTTLAALSTLVDESLVNIFEHGTSVRYSLFATTRAFAASRVEEPKTSPSSHEESQRMFKTKIHHAIIATLFVLVGVGLGSGAAFAYQVHMVNALGDLRAARAQLSAGIPDKAGHRVNAINIVDQAISETNQAIAAGAH